LNKEKLEESHFITWHAKLGLLTIMSMTIHVLIGIISFDPNWGYFIHWNNLKKNHNRVSKFIILLGFLTLLTGTLHIDSSIFLLIAIIFSLLFLYFYVIL